MKDQPLSLNIYINKTSKIRFSNHKTPFTFHNISSHDITCLEHISLYYSVFHITTSTRPDEDFQLNKKKLYIIINSHIKIIFVFGQSLEVETRQHNKRNSKHMSFFRFYLFLYIYIYIYIYDKDKRKNQTLTTGLMVIFRSLFTEEFLQKKKV